MVYTVLFSDDEDTKLKIIENIFGAKNIIFSKNYTKMKQNYERALLQIKNGLKYNFFKHRKPLKKFKKFNLLQEITPPPNLETKSNQTDVYHDLYESEKITKFESQVNDQVTILFDSNITTVNKKMITGKCTVKSIKTLVYDTIGLSVSKQEVLRNETVLSNNILLSGETVVIRQKRRSNKKYFFSFTK